MDLSEYILLNSFNDGWVSFHLSMKCGEQVASCFTYSFLIEFFFKEVATPSTTSLFNCSWSHKSLNIVSILQSNEHNSWNQLCSTYAYRKHIRNSLFIVFLCELNMYFLPTVMRLKFNNSVSVCRKWHQKQPQDGWRFASKFAQI